MTTTEKYNVMNSAHNYKQRDRGGELASQLFCEVVKNQDRSFFIFVVPLKLTGNEVQLNGSVWMRDKSDKNGIVCLFFLLITFCPFFFSA